MEQFYEEDVMYCIISLPRTASTNLWHLIQAPLVLQDARYCALSPHSIFNPRYNTPEQIEKKYHDIMQDDFITLFKVISNHNFSMVESIIETKRFKTIFLKPKDVRKQVLKTLVAKKTDSFANKESRNPYVGTLVVTEGEIAERLMFYRKHMEFEHQCDYSFFDEDVLLHPEHVLETLHLPYVKSRYKYHPPKYSDEEMLQDVNDFNHKFESLYE